jgi:hypothetical protein
MKLQWQVEKGTQIKPLYILGYTSNLGRVKKEVLKWVKSAENRLKFRIFKYQLFVSIA